MNIHKEDYAEPVCPLCMTNPAEQSVRPIDIRRMTEKLDSYLYKNDYAGAERHLDYWLAEATSGNDDRGRLAVFNEKTGLFRKLNRHTEACAAAGMCLALIEKTGLQDSITAGTVLVNAATAHKAAGQAEQALPLYDKAEEIYEKNLSAYDTRLGGLYNNKALALADTGQWERALFYYNKALSVMQRTEHGEGEQAITCLNMADCLMRQQGAVDAAENIEALLTKAQALLETESLPHDGNFAYICEKCAPVFGGYGWFVYEKKLADLAKEIYTREAAQ